MDNMEIERRAADWIEEQEENKVIQQEHCGSVLNNFN